jgi:hypothetical protein
MTMRNRKSIIVTFLLAACLLMAVGFAALNDTLDITGQAEVNHGNAQNAFDEEVYFSEVSTGTGYTAQITADANPNYNNDTATFTVTGLSGEGDEIEITFTIKNDNAFAVSCVVDPINTTTTNVEYFECTTNVGNTAFTVDANGTFDVVVTVKLLKTPQLSEGQTVSSNFSIQYDVTDIVS